MSTTTIDPLQRFKDDQQVAEFKAAEELNHLAVRIAHDAEEIATDEIKAVLDSTGKTADELSELVGLLKTARELKQQIDEATEAAKPLTNARAEHTAVVTRHRKEVIELQERHFAEVSEAHRKVSGLEIHARKGQQAHAALSRMMSNSYTQHEVMQLAELQKQRDTMQQKHQHMAFRTLVSDKEHKQELSVIDREMAFIRSAARQRVEQLINGEVTTPYQELEQ